MNISLSGSLKGLHKWK